MKTTFLFFALIFSCSTFAADIDDVDSIPASKPKESRLKHDEEVLKKDELRFDEKTKELAKKTYDTTKDFVTGKLKNYLDSSGIKGTDSTYIALPKRKWRVSLTGDIDNISVDVENDPDKGDQTWGFDLKVRPPMSASAGVWVGYMGYGFGFSYLKADRNSTNVAMNFASPNYSLNVRWIRSTNDHKLNGWAEKGMTYEQLLQSEDYAYKIESFVFDGYWIFNKKKFSLSATYDLSTIQLRSAGSFIAGMMFNYQKCDYSSPDNIGLLIKANHIGKVKMSQLSAGGGYTYNWVPTPGLVINMMAMPVLTFFSSSKLYKYNWDFHYKDAAQTEINGVTVTPDDDHNDYGRVALNVNARLAAAYRYKNFVFSIFAQANYLRSYFKGTSFKVFQWNMRGTVGITL